MPWALAFLRPCKPNNNHINHRKRKLIKSIKKKEIEDKIRRKQNLASGGEFVAEVEDGVRQAGVEGVLQVDLVSLDYALGVFGAPPQ